MRHSLGFRRTWSRSRARMHCINLIITCSSYQQDPCNVIHYNTSSAGVTLLYVRLARFRVVCGIFVVARCMGNAATAILIDVQRFFLANHLSLPCFNRLSGHYLLNDVALIWALKLGLIYSSKFSKCSLTQ